MSAHFIRISLLFFALLQLATAAHAATITVDTPGDSGAGNCTLREAIIAANTNAAFGGCTAGENTAGDVIVFTPAVTGTITLGSDLDAIIANGSVADDLTITGPGASLLTFDMNSNSTNDTRVFRTSGPNVKLVISGLTIKGGEGGVAANFDAGGNIEVVLDSVIVQGNTSHNSGGGVFNNGQTMTIRNSWIDSNKTISGFGGGFADNGGTTIIENTTISNNLSSGGGGGIHHSENGSSLAITNCTISGNKADGAGGGIFQQNSPGNTVEIVNSTITLNEADKNADNTAGDDGGGVRPGVGAGSFKIKNTILAGNLDLSPGSQAPDCDNTDTITSDGFNILGDKKGCDFGGTDGTNGDHIGDSTGTGALSANLNNLANNGGIGQTHLPQANSLAIDGGPTDTADFPATDQRGFPRPGGTASDIGALEISCGNGVTEADEACDDDGESATCDSDCTTTACGDGTTNTAAGEECDDGNATSSDGCSAVCEQEADFDGCGDGNLDAGEACDDGNIVNGDGCSAACANEGTPACGDGILQAGEDCDDGNVEDGDGCGATCEDEDGTGTGGTAGTAGGSDGGGCSLIR